MYVFNFILLFFLCSCNEPEIVNSHSGDKQTNPIDCTTERTKLNFLQAYLKNLIKDNKKKVNYINNQQIDYEKQVLKTFPTYKNFKKFTATKSSIKITINNISCNEMPQKISNLNSNIDLLKADNQEKDKQIEEQKKYFKDLLEKNHQENLKTNPKAKAPVLDITPPPEPTIIKKPPVHKPNVVAAKTTTSPSGHLGLSNKGNTCFLNSTTQMLFEALAISNIEVNNFNDPKYDSDGYAKDSSSNERRKFLEAFKKLNIVRNDPSKHGELDKSLNDYFATYKAVNKKINNTEEVGGDGGGHVGKDQCDALDYLRSVLHFIGYQVKTRVLIKPVDNKYPNKWIDGEIKDIFQFSVPNDKNKYSIRDLYKKWSEEEKIDDYDYYGNKTKKIEIKKQNDIETLQRNFFIALQRYEYGGTNGEKLNTVIIPDKNLDIQTRTGEGPGNVTINHHKAFLKSIVVQNGSTTGGHYYSYVYDEKAKKWFEYNDSSVTEISEEKVMDDASKNGYLFSYELIN